MKDFYILLMKDFCILLMKDFIFFVNEGFLYFVEGFLYFEDMNDIDKSHFLFPIKEPFRAEQLTKNLIQ
jgi:hypothetical protein